MGPKKDPYRKEVRVWVQLRLEIFRQGRSRRKD